MEIRLLQINLLNTWLNTFVPQILETDVLTFIFKRYKKHAAKQ
jgi:hypothetical protein